MAQLRVWPKLPSSAFKGEISYEMQVSSPRLKSNTLPETNMETQKGPLKSTVLLQGDYMGFHVSLGECS